MRKAQMQNWTLMIIIILAISALLLFFFYSKFNDLIKESTRDKDCLARVTGKTLTSVEYGPFAYENEMKVDCPSYTLTFMDESAELYRKNEKYKKYEYKDDEFTQEDAFKIITDEMMQCWQKFGSGRLDVFKIPAFWWERNIGDFFSGREDEIGCKVCTDISFELSEERELSGFVEYLKTTKLVSKSKKKESPGPFIYNYLAESTRHCADEYSFGDNCWEDFAIAEKVNFDTDPEIDTSEKYQIVFVRHRIREGDGTLNTYLMSIDTKNRVCQTPLPFR